ncbi:DUF4124 domain-containing protein [Shewanella sp. 125m-7]
MIRVTKTLISIVSRSALTIVLAGTFLTSTLYIFNVQASVIYTWVDDNGVTHYSQQPPEPTQSTTETDKLYSEDINPKQIGTVAPLAKVAQNSGPSDLETNAAMIKQADKKQAKLICKNAQHSLNVLTTHSKLNKKNKDTGEVVAMTEEQRQASITEQRERVKLFCTK